jgi:hypothetical protein
LFFLTTLFDVIHGQVSRKAKKLFLSKSAIIRVYCSLFFMQWLEGYNSVRQRVCSSNDCSRSMKI